MASKTWQVTRSDVEGLLNATFPGMVDRLQKEEAAVADLIRLRDIQGIVAPVKIDAREVIWADDYDNADWDALSERARRNERK